MSLAAIQPNGDASDYGPDRSLPFDLQAERSVLGGMLLSRNAIEDCLDIVVAHQFYRPQHESIFDAIANLHFEGLPVDAITVADHLRRQKLIDKVGGQAYLHELIASVPTASNASYYATIVVEKATLRAIVEAGTRVTQLGYAQGGGDIDDIVAAAQGEVDAIATRHVTELVSAADYVDSTLEMLENPEARLSTPWPSMDRALDGLSGGRVYVIGARPASGKTTMGLNLALWFMQKHGKAVAFNSLEMSRDELIVRVLATMSNVDHRKISKGRAAQSRLEREAISNAAAQLRRLPTLWINDNEQITPGQVRSHARMAARRSDLGLIVVDYIGLMDSGRKTNSRQEDVAVSSRLLKRTAKGLNVPLALLSQLNRGPEGRDSGPRMSDLRDSGAVEQDADVVALLWRPDPESDEVNVGIAKNRQGPTMAFPLTLDGPHYRLIESERMEGM